MRIFSYSTGTYDTRTHMHTGTAACLTRRSVYRAALVTVKAIALGQVLTNVANDF